MLLNEKKPHFNIEQAWEKIFEKYDILARVQTDGIYYITSKEINEYKEARLMAKFDQSSQLPKIFLDNHMSILPVTRGKYAIGQFATHTNIVYPTSKPTPVVIPNLQTIDSNNLYSEAAALMFAFNSGIIKDILGDSRVNFTVAGRMASGNFDFSIKSTTGKKPTNISVQNAQVEIDAGYESPDAFCICEAKNIATNELLIRQLYYPYRLWENKLSIPVIPVFFVFSNDIFHVFTYKFEEKGNYNSIKLLNYASYTFAEENITLEEIIDLWRSISVKEEPKVTFPQANSFERVLDLLSVLFEEPLTHDEVTLKYEFDPRQTNYYITACAYLGLVERTNNDNEEHVYTLSENAKHIMNLKTKPKYLALIKLILEKPVFYKAFEVIINSGEVPEAEQVIKIMLQAHLSINQTTIERRSSTVRGWLEWILRQTIE